MPGKSSSSGNAYHPVEQDGVCIFDRHWRFRFASSGALGHMRMTRDQVYGKTMWDVYPDVVGKKLEMDMRRAFDAPMPTRFESVCEGHRYVCVVLPSPEGVAFHFHELAAEGVPERTPTPPLVLAAAPAAAHPYLRNTLVSDVRLVPVARFDDAVEALERQHDIQVVACGVHFDDSRMLDLLRHCYGRLPGMPFVCFQVVEGEIPATSSRALRLVAESSGAMFIDLPKLIAEVGARNAQMALRAEVLSHIPTLRASSLRSL